MANLSPAKREWRRKWDRQRNGRKRAVRAATVSARTPRHALVLLRRENAGLSYSRPRTRGDCELGVGIRPCPFAGCRYHLYLDIFQKTGGIRINFPDLAPWEIGESCALDVADRGGAKLEDVGAIINVTRERIRQIEEIAIRKLKLAGWQLRLEVTE